MQVEVVTSTRRRKTVQARLVDGVLRIAMPAHLSPTEQDRWIGVMRERFERRLQSEDIDLPGRARKLAKEYGLSQPDRIDWSDRQNTRWGSCTPADGSVRISRRVAPFPRWVLDYVIVHELAHLDQPGHDAGFWALVSRYPMAERARGYLIAKSDGCGEFGSDS
ncbi:MAG TPA: M48 family metallopeptidase [Acidimicrobiia bacterium]|jgi:predicted metal-dependent hydrolase|nr:M48 family metallopeptidase [Acidimicrobiia bacterium]